MQKSDKLTNLEVEKDLLFPSNVPIYMENLIALGILRTHETLTLSNPAWYEPLYGRYEPLRKSIEDKGHDDGARYPVTWIRGYFELTTYGRMFLSACVAKIPGPTF